jgi:hypothetical protein
MKRSSMVTNCASNNYISKRRLVDAERRDDNRLNLEVCETIE